MEPAQWVCTLLKLNSHKMKYSIVINKLHCKGCINLINFVFSDEISLRNFKLENIDLDKMSADAFFESDKDSTNIYETLTKLFSTDLKEYTFQNLKQL
jgi:hypothetical protein